MSHAATILALLVGLTSHAGIIEGRVVSVADGDTVTVLDVKKVQHKIRLSGIDAPEKAQAFGNRSKESLSNLVFSKAVTVTFGRIRSSRQSENSKKTDIALGPPSQALNLR